MLLPTIKRQNIYEQVVEHLKKYIIDNELRPGDRLPTEAELAQRFQVSRQSVREAVKVLGKVEGIAIVEFTRRDIVRHPLVQRIIVAYEEHRGRAMNG